MEPATRQIVSVELEASDVDALNALAIRHNLTLTGALQRAIRQSKYLDDLIAAGNTLLVEDPRKKGYQKLIVK